MKVKNVLGKSLELCNCSPMTGCVCAGRWFEAYQAGKACPVNLDATHEETLAVIPLTILREFQV